MLISSTVTAQMNATKPVAPPKMAAMIATCMLFAALLFCESLRFNYSMKSARALYRHNN